jgi:hypothetical protein
MAHRQATKIKRTIKLVLQRPAQARHCANCSHIDTAETPQLPCDIMAPISDCGAPTISRTLCCFLLVRILPAIAIAQSPAVDEIAGNENREPEENWRTEY